MSESDPQMLLAAEKFHHQVLLKLEDMEMSVPDYCELLGITPATFHGIKARGSLPSTRNVAALALTLGLDLNELLAPLVPSDIKHLLREYIQRKKKVEESRAVYERQELELQGVVKKFKINRNELKDLDEEGGEEDYPANDGGCN